MTTNNREPIWIEYASLNLQVARTEDHQDVTPLKPLVEFFSLDWEEQYRQVTESEFLKRFLGLCVVSIDGEHPCILLSRVSAYLNNLNPDDIRAAGNEEAADWLIAKHQEWDDALHKYETAGIASKGHSILA